MRRFFEPASAPLWLKPVLVSIREALGDIFDVPVRPAQFAAAELPAAADFTGGIAWNATTLTINWSDGSSWKAPQAQDADLDAIAALSSTGLLARTGAGAWALRSIAGTANEISVANGGGVLGAPTLSLPAALTFTGKTLTGGAITALSRLGVGNANLADSITGTAVVKFADGAHLLTFKDNASG